MQRNYEADLWRSQLCHKLIRLLLRVLTPIRLEVSIETETYYAHRLGAGEQRLLG